jgi:hypothetical protein
MDLDSLALTLHFMSQFCIARGLDCNLLEAVANSGALSSFISSVVLGDQFYMLC